MITYRCDATLGGMHATAASGPAATAAMVASAALAAEVPILGEVALSHFDTTD